MRTSLPVLLVLAMLTGLSACASKKLPTPAPPPKPLYAAHTATLDVTEGIRVIGVVSMPPRFAPNPAYAPLWLQQGSEVGIVGNADGKMTVLGFSGPELGNRRVISEDFGVSAPGGRILDIAASSDGLEIATAVAEPRQNRLEVILRDAINAGGGQPLASIGGSFDSAQLTWLDAETIALILPAPALSNEQALAQGVTPISGGGLYVITVTGQTSVKHLNKVGCPLSRLAFSPNRYFAISEGDTTAPPVIVDVQDQTCRALALRGPIKMLAWAPDSNAFLYAASIDELHSTGVFRFDLTTGRSVPTAVSSGAAAYAGDGTVVALGNSELSWKRIAANPNMKAKAQIALFDPHQSEIKIDSLGFETTPTMLAQSTMAFSTVSDDGAIDTAIPGMAGALREVIEYSYPARAAFILAAGGAQGPLMMSWSPDGKMIAFVDGNSQLTTLTVIAPPR